MVASGNLRKNITRILIFMVANATILGAVWSPAFKDYLFIFPLLHYYGKNREKNRLSSVLGADLTRRVFCCKTSLQSLYL